MDKAIMLDAASYDPDVAMAGYIATCCSLAGIIFVILIFFCVPETRKNFFFNLGFYISISDLIFVASTMYTQNPLLIDSDLCKVLGVGREFGLLSSIFWAAIIAWCVFKSLNYNISDDELFRDKWFFVVLGYVPPLLIAVIPELIYSEFYGPSDTYCWLSHSKEMFLITTAGMYYAPFTISFILCMIWYCRTIKLIRAYITQKISKEFLKLMLYPLVLFLCNIGAVVQCFYVVFVDHNGLFWLQFAYVIIRQLQGFLNALVYANNYGVRNAIKRRYHRMTGASSIHVDSSASVIVEQFESFEADNKEFLIEKYCNLKKSYLDRSFD